MGSEEQLSHKKRKGWGVEGRGDEGGRGGGRGLPAASTKGVIVEENNRTASTLE